MAGCPRRRSPSRPEGRRRRAPPAGSASASRSPYASVKMPVAAGRIVSVLGDVMLNSAELSEQKQSTLPAVVPVELRIRAYRIWLRFELLAVNTTPMVDIVNLYCLAEAPTTQEPVAGTRLRPPTA